MVTRSIRARKPSLPSRPADALSGAQARERFGVRLGGEEIGKPRKAVADRRERGESVILAAQMRARARPDARAPD